MRRLLRLFRLLAAGLVVVLLMTSCSLLGGSSGDSPSSSGSLEKSTLTVGVLPVADSAPFYLALDRGFFRDEGLTVDVQLAANGGDTVTKLVGGSFDIGIASYPAFFAAQVKKVADLAIAVDAYQSRPGHCILLTTGRSPIKSPEDVPGRKIAVSGRGTVSDLSLMAALKVRNLDYSKVQWVEASFPNMGGLLQTGSVDGMLAIEPFITKAEKDFGAIQVLDTFEGPTADFPQSGWGLLRKFAKDNPNTVAAFQRAMAKGTDLAQNRAEVEPLLVKYTKVDKDTAALVTISTYPKTLEPRRLQRPADLMAEFNVIPKRVPYVPSQRLAELDVTPLLLPPPAPVPAPPTSAPTSSK
jgi:NitT/TauT family transport system substrate-binding protein